MKIKANGKYEKHYEKAQFCLHEATAKINMTISYLPQGKLAEVYLGFKNMMEIIHIYEGTSEKHGERFQSLYLETVSLASRFDREEK